MLSIDDFITKELEDKFLSFADWYFTIRPTFDMMSLNKRPHNDDMRLFYEGASGEEQKFIMAANTKYKDTRDKFIDILHDAYASGMIIKDVREEDNVFKFKRKFVEVLED